MPLQIGKTPIVVPRQHQYNEHVNDHQVEFARNVAQRMGTIIPVEDINTLGDVITNYDQIVAGISSLYVAREYIENAFILDGDQIIYNPEILAPAFERSGYNSVWTDDETDEWLQTVENGIVTACSRTGGKGGWQLYSISRWTAEDGKKLKRHLEIEFEQKKNRQIYWDDVAMFCYPEEYQLGIRPMNKDDIIEVDNLSELIALDASYKKYVEEK